MNAERSQRCLETYGSRWNREALVLPGGEMPNKLSMLRVAASLGFNVPMIYSDEEIGRLINTQRGDWLWRGYTPHLIDNWGVDIFETEDFEDGETWQRAQARLISAAGVMTRDGEEKWVSRYLRNNFGINEPVEVKGFAQERVEGNLITGWSRGNKWVVNSVSERGLGVEAFVFVGEDLLFGDGDLGECVRRAGCTRLMVGIKEAFNRVFGGSFEYQVDMIVDLRDWQSQPSLVQVKVMSPEVDRVRAAEMESAIDKMKHDGVQVVTIGLSELATYNLQVPVAGPCVLELLSGVRSGAVPRERTRELDMRGIVGLIFDPTQPLLMHNGAQFLSRCEYWGLPVILCGGVDLLDESRS